MLWRFYACPANIQQTFNKFPNFAKNPFQHKELYLHPFLPANCDSIVISEQIIQHTLQFVSFVVFLLKFVSFCVAPCFTSFCLINCANGANKRLLCDHKECRPFRFNRFNSLAIQSEFPPPIGNTKPSTVRNFFANTREISCEIVRETKMNIHQEFSDAWLPLRL